MIVGAVVFQTMGQFGSIEGARHRLLNRQDFVEAVKEVLDMGYRQIELPADHLLLALGQEELEQLMIDLGDIRRTPEPKWAVHLPFLWLNGSSLDENIRQASAQTHLNIIKTTRSLNPTHYVLHSISNMTLLKTANITEDVRDLMLSNVIDAAKRTATELIDALSDPSQLCIENLTNVDFRWDLDIVKELGTSICFDVGHHVHRGGNPLEFLDEHLPRIKCIHAHNIMPAISERDAKNWKLVDHCGLGEGLIGDKPLFTKLVEKEYSASVIVEVRGSSEGEKSTKFLKQMRLI